MRSKFKRQWSFLAIAVVLVACGGSGAETTTSSGAALTTQASVASTTTEAPARADAFEGVPLPEGATEITTEGITSPEDVGLASFGGAWKGGEFETIDFDTFTWAAREFEVGVAVETVVDFYRNHPDALLQEISPPFSGLYFWGRDDDGSRVLFVLVTEGNQPDTSMFLILEGRSRP